MTDENTQQSSQNPQAQPTEPKTIEINVPGADPAAHAGSAGNTEAASAPEAQQEEAAPQNAYAAKASSAYKQQAAQPTAQPAAQAGSQEAKPESDKKTAGDEGANGDVWDEMDVTPPETDTHGAKAAQAADAQALEAQIAELKDQLVRAVAEQENVRKRMTREIEDARKFAAGKFAGDMLSVADNLRRALDSVSDDVREQEAVKLLLEGVELTEKDLLAAFERHKLVRVDPQGEKFNPNLHEAMFEIPSADVEPGTVMQVVQPGYMIADRLLRPARVGVSKAL